MNIEQSILQVVEKLLANNEQTTVARIAQELGRTPQSIHQVLKTSKLLKKVPGEKYTIIVPVEISTKAPLGYNEGTPIEEDEEEPSSIPFDIEGDEDNETDL